jgi:plastocyanin
MKRARTLLQKLLFNGTLTIASAVAVAPRSAEAAEAGPSAADFARLQKEVAEQRALIIQMMQIEQQRYDMLLRLMQSGGAPAAGVMPAIPSPPPPAGTATPPASASAAPAAKPEREHVSSYGSVSGRVSAKSGSLKDAYVYVDMVKGAPARGHSLEIRQKDKQFSPQVAVVQRGTTVVFPNMDAVFHNVFSPSGKNAFDLGSYRSGDTPRSVVLTTPGVVEVYCNIHARMNATVLVVPSPLYTKVSSDGTFRLENVPSGARKLVAWSPGAKPVQERVEIGSGSPAQVAFTLEYEGAKAHTNKLGQPYGSYKE